MTKISFIVVAYNAAQSLDALLGDLLAQTVDPRQLEALLVDSASTDDTAQIMRRFAERAPFEVKLLENPEALAGLWHQRSAARRDGRRNHPAGRARAHAEGFSAKKSRRAGSRKGYRRRKRHRRGPRQRLGSRHARAGYLALLRRRSALSATAEKRAMSIRWPTRSIAAKSMTAWVFTTSVCAAPRITTCTTACARRVTASIFRRISSRGTPRARRFAASSARNGATATGLGAQCGFSRAALPRAISYPRCSCWR